MAAFLAQGAGAGTAGKASVLGAVAPAAGAGAVSADSQLIAFFIAKWMLNPEKTRAALEKLTPQRLRYVLTNFKHIGTCSGVAVDTALEQYLKLCESLGTWDKPMQAGVSSASAKPTGVVVAPTRPVLGGSEGGALNASTIASIREKLAAAKAESAKRPLGLAAGFMDPAKRPALGNITVTRPWASPPPGLTMQVRAPFGAAASVRPPGQGGLAARPWAGTLRPGGMAGRGW
eukprot:gnl/TRDRNA2_/TRDRNA2_170217_c0_seq1.p1 gnl/TRDRNA2_/TRDRNA2_170217_c0~~gnl/TRDRNA2_/TRDRNA2_170217_c0_seq1.p1  ORF type:complete len:264 (+),score=48.08 gnl/TRDRNA2_/TRDRNA2_170217_c0_seq1:97-792(+)